MSGAPSPAVEAFGVCKSFAETVVLDGIDLTVAEGTIFALLGPNGAGKTTMVHILSTQIPADAGTASVMGHDVCSEAEAVRAVIVVLLASFCCTMIVIGTRYAMLTWAQTTPVTQIPVGAVYLAMPAGFVLMIVHLALMARGHVARRELLGDGEFDADAARL